MEERHIERQTDIQTYITQSTKREIHNKEIKHERNNKIKK